MIARLCFVLVLVGLAGVIPAEAQTTTKTKGDEARDRMNAKTDQRAAKAKEAAMGSGSKAGDQAGIARRVNEIDKEANEEKKLNNEAVKRLGPQAQQPYVPKKPTPVVPRKK